MFWSLVISLILCLCDLLASFVNFRIYFNYMQDVIVHTMYFLAIGSGSLESNKYTGPQKKWNKLYMWVYYPYGFSAAESEPGLRISPGPPSFSLAQGKCVKS